MTRTRRPVVLVVLALAAACTAHEPPPKLEVPDEPPPLAEWRGPTVVPEMRAEVETGAETGPEVVDWEPETGPVKVVESAEDMAYEDGKRDAQAAIAAGKLGLETFGLPSSCRPDYARVLQTDYGVVLRTKAGCVVNDAILGHARGYNEVMTAEIERRFGADALDRAARKSGCR